MENVVLVALVVIAVPIIAGIWLIVHTLRHGEDLERLQRRIATLEGQMARERTQTSPLEKAEPEISKPSPRPVAPEPPPIPAYAPPPRIQPKAEVFAEKIATPSIPPISTPLPKIETPPPAPPMRAAINWEQFMGVKGFAWLGGFALFLGIAFFVKYSFDNNLISPALRVTIGFVTGTALIVGGIFLERKERSALSQTLCATGVVVLYAVTFACHAYYHFAAFGPIATFIVMSVITAAAFSLAVNLNALVVAVLGMLGGFLTPILLSTGQDNPLALFAYLAVLDAGLILVALNRKWDFLPLLGAVGTIFMQVGWASDFFEREKYFDGNKIYTAFTVLLAFNLLYLAANWLAKKRDRANWWLMGSNLALAAVAMAFPLYFFSFPSLAARPPLVFSFLLVIDLIVTATSSLKKDAAPGHTGAGIAVFGVMAIWTSQYLTLALLNTALLFYFVFAVLHTVWPALQRRRGVISVEAARASHVFPVAALALVLVPVFKLATLSIMVWPFVLLVDLMAIALAAFTATLMPVLLVLILTLIAIGGLICNVPADLSGLTGSLFLIGIFAFFFVSASMWLIRKFLPQTVTGGIDTSGDMKDPQLFAAIVPASSAVLPFALLILATLRLHLPDPSPIFAVALLLGLLLLGLTRIFTIDWMPLVGMVSVFVLECMWHFNQFETYDRHLSPSGTILGWYLLFYGVFALFPFVFFKKFAGLYQSWTAAALAGPAQFFLVYRLVKLAWPNSVMGLLPAAFAVPAAVSLFAVWKFTSMDNKSRLSKLAWFGGVTLFFVTLIFPVQFDRQWITIGWGLEGAALLWLFHRVPHPGLRLTGIGLLIAAFARLVFNPAVLDYHPRSATAIFNWYLYAYGIVTAALFVGARLLSAPRNFVQKINVQALLAALGVILAFCLVNIEIADYFSAPGSTLTFEFGGNFGREMTYTIAWAIFALVLLIYGITKKLAGARYPAMALLCVTLLKLFFHDLAQLGQLYRSAAFVSVAIVAMLASWAYNKFFSIANKAAPVKGEMK